MGFVQKEGELVGSLVVNFVAGGATSGAVTPSMNNCTSSRRFVALWVRRSENTRVQDKDGEYGREE